MNYSDRFTSKVVQTKQFSNESTMVAFINENEIETIHVYTSQDVSTIYDTTYSTNFHLMYKIVKKVII